MFDSPRPARDTAVLHNGSAFTLHHFERAEQVKKVTGKIIGWRFWFRCSVTGRSRQFGLETPRGAVQMPCRAA
jgi:hypothetical protein